MPWPRSWPAEGGWRRISASRRGGGRFPRGPAAGLALLFALALFAGAGAAEKAPPTAPLQAERVPLAVDLTTVPEITPNASVSGSIGAGAPRFYKVFANRSDASPETLGVTIEATGSLFGDGSLSIYDPEQVLLDERFTNNPGDLQVSLFIVAETGYYLLVVASDTSYTWGLTVNWTSGGAFPTDNDNDLANATLLTGDSGNQADSVTDWDDLVDLYAIDLGVSPPRADALLVNLTSPNTADIDVHLFHVVAGVAVLDGLSISPTGTEYAAALAGGWDRYFIRVSSYSGSSTYNLEWGRLNVSADHNALPENATPLGPGSFQNNLSRWDTRDLFTFFLPANTTLNVTFTNLAYNATSGAPDLLAVLWDANFSRITWSFDFDPNERINALVPADGTYYLDVYGSSSLYYLTTAITFAYSMNVSIDRPPALVFPTWNFTGTEDVSAVVDLLGVIPRDPAGEAMTYTVVQAVGQALAAVAPDGHTLTVTPTPDAFGAVVVHVAAQDRRQRVVIALPFAFAPENDPPRILAGAPEIVFDEDGSLQVDAAALVFDPEGDTWTVSNVSAPPSLAVSFSSGSFQLSSAPDFNGAGTLQVTLEDALGASQTVDLPFTVLSVNDPPRFGTAPGPFVLNEDAAATDATFSLAGAATDADGDPIVYTLEGVIPVLSLVVGTDLSLVPDADVEGEFSARLVASDGVASATLTVTVRVLAVNDPPRLNAPQGALHATEGAPFSFEAFADDIDTPFGTLTYAFSIDGGPAGALGPSPSFTRTFGFDEAGFHILHVTVSDGNLSASAEFTITVAGANRPPNALILTPRNASFAQGAVIAFASRATDPDGDEVNVTWVVDGTAASFGPAFSMERLPPGRHTVELLVFDGEFTTSDTAAFDVQAGLPGPGFALSLLALFAPIALAALARRRAGTSINSSKSLK